jgi:phosphopantetheinyl transferase
VLSLDDQERAARFVLEHRAHADIVAHAMLRRIRAHYDVGAADELRFAAGEFWKPVLIAERAALHTLGPDVDATTEGVFNAWTRKEAYLKATGHGITRGLHHFDVSLAPADPATLIADRLDPSAPEQWRMTAIDAAQDYGGAVVATPAVTEILRFDAD